MPEVLQSCWSISDKTDRFARRILPTHAKAPAAGGSGNRISATEGLFTAGEVMVVERRNFHRVYDLTRRVMPHWDDERDALPATLRRPSCCATAPAASASFAPVAGGLLSFTSAGATGFAGGPQEEGLVVPVDVEALGEMWLHRDALAQLESAPGGKLTASHSAVLAFRPGGLGSEAR